MLAREDPDVAHALSQLLTDEGVDVLLDTATLRVDGTHGAWRITVRANGSERAVEATHVLAAMGRTPNTDGIGLDVAGIELDARGYIAVNDRLETSAEGVWAMGECAGSPQFTHAAFDDFRVVYAHLTGGNRSTRGRIVPFCLFTDPELARVGLNETEARRRGIAVRVASLPMQRVLRTETTGETRGFMKALIDARSDDILGFTMFGAEAGEVASIVQTAMTARLPYTSLRDMILAHPDDGGGPQRALSRAAAARRHRATNSAPRRTASRMSSCAVAAGSWGALGRPASECGSGSYVTGTAPTGGATAAGANVSCAPAP